MARVRTGVIATHTAKEVSDENAVKSGSNVVIISVPGRKRNTHTHNCCLLNTNTWIQYVYSVVVSRSALAQEIFRISTIDKQSQL